MAASNTNVDIEMTQTTTAAIETTSNSLLNDNESDDAGGSQVLTTTARTTSYSSTQSLSVSEDEPNPLADFMSGDLMAKPFTYVTKTEKSLNPFRKKSGLLNVLAKKSTQSRICTKKGALNIFTDTEVNQTHKFLGDIFVSIIELNWYWINFIFAASFFLSWLGFALIWYLIFWVHGDFDLKNLNPEDNSTYVDNFTPELRFYAPFTSCFLFSLETQHTIGYGVKATTEECPSAIILMSIQSIVGVIISTCMAGKELLLQSDDISILKHYIRKPSAS